MKKLIILIFTLFVTVCVQAQVKTIRGQLKLEDGRILNNQAFKVVGRNLSGKTDKNGYFTLSNVIDDDIIAVAGWPNFQVSNVTISVISVTTIPVASSLLENDADTLGVIYMVNTMPPNQYRNNNDVSKIVSFGQTLWNNNKAFIINEANSYHYYKGGMVNYTSFIDVATVGKLPELQTEYAQGRENSWRGAELNEVFSWGPKISNLEYSGQAYPYDKSGTLVPLGSGNGQKANVYDPTDFFRTGISFGNSVDIKFRGLKKGVSTLSVGQRKNNSPISNAYKESYNVSLMMDKVETGRFTSSFGVLYKSSYAKLNEQGANLSTLLHSILTTPPTFDNANGLSRNQAVNGSEAWLLDDNTQRAYAKDAVNNPFMLINNLPDRQKSDNLLAYVKTQYQYDDLKASASFSYDKQWDSHHNGMMVNPFNHNTYRKHELSNIIASADFLYLLTDESAKLYLMANYGFKRTSDDLYREDVLVSQPQAYINNENLSRNAHDIKYGIKISNNSNLLEVHNKHYFSNTVKSSKYVNMFPEVGFNLSLKPIFEDAFYLYRVNISLYGSSGRSIGEPSLIYNNPATLSTNLKSDDFRHFFEYADILFNKNLHPEIYFKNEIGVRYNTYNGKFTSEFNWFTYNTRNFTSPVFDGTNYTLQNLGRLNNYGYFISLAYYERISNSAKFDVMLNFSQTWNKASSLYADEPFVRLAGFSDIATVFAEDKPLGAIYGTSYLRNDKNQVIIGDDGFPLVDNNLKMIGDPTPDFKITLAPTLQLKQFTFGVTMEYSHGGDRWNGTKAMLDYHGVSATSAKDRNVSDYIFDGVNMAGNANTKPVDFYKPANPISENKWIRYGASGVGEDYIEKASYFRISDVSVSYSLYNYNRGHLFKSIKLRLSAHNLLLLTKYKGVDPSSFLFGYSSGAGLDLFNQPSLRGYSFSLTFEL